MIRVVLYLGGELAYDIFFVRGSVYILRDVVRILCTFLFFIFSYIILLYTGLVMTYLWYILYLFSFIYMLMYIVFHLSLHMLFLFSLYIHVSLCMQSLFLFHTKMPWWLLFKVFQKDKLSKSIMSWTLFLQSFSRVCVRVRFFCIPTSGYEFSDLRLLSWFICVLWLCHGLPNGEIVRTYVRIVRDICYVN